MRGKVENAPNCCAPNVYRAELERAKLDCNHSIDRGSVPSVNRAPDPDNLHVLLSIGATTTHSNTVNDIADSLD